MIVLVLLYFLFGKGKTCSAKRFQKNKDAQHQCQRLPIPATLGPPSEAAPASGVSSSGRAAGSALWSEFPFVSACLGDASAARHRVASFLMIAWHHSVLLFHNLIKLNEYLAAMFFSLRHPRRCFIIHSISVHMHFLCIFKNGFLVPDSLFPCHHFVFPENIVCKCICVSYL